MAVALSVARRRVCVRVSATVRLRSARSAPTARARTHTHKRSHTPRSSAPRPRQVWLERTLRVGLFTALFAGVFQWRADTERGAVRAAFVCLNTCTVIQSIVEIQFGDCLLFIWVPLMYA